MNNKEANTTYPYPSRPSVLVAQEEYGKVIRDSEEEKVNLKKNEEAELFRFETSLFRKFKKARGIPGSVNTLYPQSFTSEEGSRLYSLAYLDDGLKKRFKKIAQENGVDIKRKPSVKTKYWNAVFDDLSDIAKDDELYKAYSKKGVNFPYLQKYLKSDEEIIISGKPARLADSESDVDFDTVVQVTSNINLSKVPSRIRTRMNKYSYDESKEVLKEQLLSGDKVENPIRVYFVVHADVYKKRLRGLRGLKEDIKSNLSELKDKEDDLSRAKVEVLNLYRRRLNVTLASEYDLVAALGSKANLTSNERELLSMMTVREHDGEEGRALKVVARVDRFLRGVGLKYLPEGMLVVVPEKLSDHAKVIANRGKSESEDYRKYNSIMLDDNQMKRMTQIIINSSNNEKARKWKAEVQPKKKRWYIKHKSGGRFVREIVVPRGDSRGLIDALAVASHEFEGHVTQRQNKENLGRSLHLTEELSTGRSAIMSECGAMAVEARTLSEVVDQNRTAEPYYYLAIKRKSEGGTFVGCLQTFMKSYGNRKFDLSYEELLNDKDKFNKAYEYSYTRTLSIFRSKTPLDDESGEITTSAQLKYVEQELLGEALTSAGLEKLMYLSGVDLYSVESLLKLGMLDLADVVAPDYITSRVVWPKVKKMIDEGKDIDEVLQKLEEELENNKKID